MHVLFYLVLFLTISYGSCGVVIPEQLTSLLFNGYGSIPPIKKGTDSRVGFGYAFGNHADFQVLFELGPQTNTKKLDRLPFPASMPSNKRHAPITAGKLDKSTGETDASMYLQSWAQKMKYPTKTQDSSTKATNSENSVEDMVTSKQEIKKELKIEDILEKDIEMPESSDGEKKENLQKTVENRNITKLEDEKVPKDFSNVELD